MEVLEKIGLKDALRSKFVQGENIAQAYQFVATGNADVNAPMLSINRRMGFKRYIGFSMYKFKVNELCHRLGLRP